MITTRCIEKIKNLVDIYDVVAPYVTLKKCGVNWRGLSPFNHEKTPSFFVMPEKKMFRCFSSGQAGDIFRFIQLKENLSFVEAVEAIASRFNITLEFEKSKNAAHTPYSKKTLFDINELACELFVKNFHGNNESGEKIRHYWTQQRHFTLDIAKENTIGLGCSSARYLMKTLMNAKFPLDVIKASGLFFHKTGETDTNKFALRFSSRLTIPIRDIQGRIVGFSARLVDGITPNSDFSDAKYINSPETEIFHKGRLLFGLDHARQYIDDEKVFWLVEGQFDAMRCWANGINTAIAPQGTAITDTQLNILRRYGTHINCMLDGDAAGGKAAERLLPLAIAAGLDVKFFLLPDGQDPDGYFQDNFAQKFHAIQKSGISGMEFLCGRWLRRDMSAMEKSDGISRIFEVLSATDSSIVQESYLGEISSLANLDRFALSREFQSFLSKRKFTSAPTVTITQKNTTNKKISSAEKQLLSLVLLDKTIAEKLSTWMDCPFLQNLSSEEGKLLMKILYEVKECVWEGMATLSTSDVFSEEERNLSYALAADWDDDADKNTLANLCIKKLHEMFIKSEIAKIDEKFLKISLDETDAIRILQENRLNLRKLLSQSPQIS